MRLASRMDRIGTETAFEAAARARALEATGVDVVHLEVGEPDFDTPANIRAAAKQALDEGKTHYAPFAGIPELRAAIADDATARKGFPVSPDQVFVTVGGKGVMLYAIEALVDDGDEVIVPDPGYPIYESLVSWIGGSAIPIPIRQANGFRLDPDELASLVTPRTRMIVLADEIYGRILYEGEHVSIASLPGMAERTVVLDGFSKTYAMTGWRLGYAIVPEWLAFAFGRLIINSVSNVCSFAQHGAVEALRGPQDEVDKMVAEFHARRDLVVDGLNAIPGISCLRPSGAFYVLPQVSGTGLTGTELSTRLLYEAGVSTLAGTAFGGVATDHIRLSYATSQANIRTALDRIGQFVGMLAVSA